MYRLATVADSLDGALPAGADISSGDIALGGYFGVSSAYQIVKENNGYWHWIKNDKQGVARLDSLRNDDFTAQTVIASSFGYMQILYSTAVAPMQWNKDPVLLFDTPENRAAGQGSLGLGTSYLQNLCWASADVTSFTAGGGDVSWQNEGGMRSAFKPVWARYNGVGSAAVQYGTSVSNRVGTYMPAAATAIFGVTQ